MSHLFLDPRLDTVVAQFGELPPIQKSENLYTEILSSIVSQQLSVKAANTIWKRFISLFPNSIVEPQLVLLISDDKIREQGISRPKISYIKGISEAVINGSLLVDSLHTMTDQEVIDELTKLKGIGKWSAEMILIFSLGRSDIFSLGDLGLRNAVAKLYGVDRDDLVEIQKISERWAPNRSLASRYLWKSLDNAPK